MKRWSLFLGVCWFFTSSFAGLLYGSDFSKDRKKLADDVSINGGPNQSVRLALYFATDNAQSLRREIDLVTWKRNIAREFLKSFTVTDPTIVNEVITQKGLGVRDLEGNPENMADLSAILDHTHLTFATISSNAGSYIEVHYLTLDRKGNKISSFGMIHPIGETAERGSVASVLPSFESDKNQVAQTDDYFGLEDYYPELSGSGRDTTFGFYAANAFLAEKTYFVDAGLWLSNVADVIVYLKHFRFAYRHEIFQVDLETRGSDDAYHHSSYVQGRIGVLSRDKINIPLDLTLGLRARAFWNDLNEDYTYSKDKDVSDKNKNKDRLSFFASMAYGFPEWNTTANFYADNVRLVLRGFYDFRNDFYVAGDLIHFTYEGDARHPDQHGDYSAPDFAVSGGYSGNEGYVFDLAYQNRTRQVVLSMKVSY